MAIRLCILDRESEHCLERYVVRFDDQDDGPAMRAIALWVTNPELAFEQRDADSMLKSIFLFSPLTQWELGT